MRTATRRSHPLRSRGETGSLSPPSGWVRRDTPFATEGRSLITIATIVLTVLLGLCTGVLGTLAVVWRREALARARRPVVEHARGGKPPYIRDLEARNRWESVDPAFLHEINREEFERLMRRVRRASVRSLSVPERAFMDRMAESERRVRASRARAAREGVRRERTSRETRRLQVTGFSASPFTH